MRKLVVGEYLSLDGVMESPEQWTFDYFNEEVGAYLGASLAESDALLLGRVTYETFAATFAHQSGGQADVMNHLQKYVVSTTLQQVDWMNTTVVQRDLREEITRLKQQPGKNITVSGSGTLVRSLLTLGLIDELSLLVYPVLLGNGKRLFGEGLDRMGLKVIEVRPFNNGLALLRYQPENRA